MKDKQVAHKAPYNTQPAGLEKALDDFFHKTLKLELPEGGKKWIADNSWWIVLVGGILSLLSIFSLWSAAQVANTAITFTNELSTAMGGSALASNIGLVTYFAMAASAAQGILLLMASQKLKVYQKAGWNLVFYSSYISAAVAVVYLFSSLYGVASLVGGVIGIMIGWFFLFQVRAYFTK